MKIGLKIEIPNEYGSYLKEIFESVDLTYYEWEVIFADIFYKEDDTIQQKSFFPSNLLDGDTFKGIISQESYYLIFLDLLAYPINVNRTRIKMFEDFIESECQLVFVLYDCSYVSIYCKDEKTLEAIYYNCKDFNCDSMNYISMEEAKGKQLIF